MEEKTLDEKVDPWEEFEDCELENPPEEDPTIPLEKIHLYVQEEIEQSYAPLPKYL